MYIWLYVLCQYPYKSIVSFLDDFLQVNNVEIRGIELLWALLLFFLLNEANNSDCQNGVEDVA